jgi:putative transcriptional regulator
MKRDAFDQLVESVREAGAIRGGVARPSRVFRFAPADVKAIRTKLGKSQAEFSLMIGVSVATLRNWEQGRRRPEGPALALLRVVSAAPKAVTRVRPNPGDKLRSGARVHFGRRGHSATPPAERRLRREGWCRRKLRQLHPLVRRPGTPVTGLSVMDLA